MGVFYIRSHGGMGRIWTTTPVTPDNDLLYAEDIAAGRLGKMTAPGANNPDYDPHDPACLTGLANKPPVCHETLSEQHYSITSAFMREYWVPVLADHPLVVLDACGSMFAIPGIGAAVPSSVLGWSGTVSQLGSDRILALFFDRQLGLNKALPDETPDLRPFDGDAVGQYLKERKQGVDAIHKNAQLVVSDAGPTSLVPSIKLLEVDEDNDELVIEGLFGDEEGLVTINGDYPDIIDWQRGLIRVELKDTMAGPVTVEQKGRKSNEVPLTEWRGTMSYTGDAGPLGKNLVFDADFDLHLRADVHLYREVPWEEPSSRYVNIRAAGDSTATWKASGTNSQGGATMRLTGSGEMKVEEAGVSHDQALFNVTARLHVIAWGTPPIVSNAEVHAHLASDPKSKLVIETGGQTITSGFPLPQTDALSKIPFDFDLQLNIAKGTKPSSAGGLALGKATLTWERFSAKFPPDMTNPPQAGIRPSDCTLTTDESLLRFFDSADRRCRIWAGGFG